MLTAHLPRVSLAFLPTPLQELPRLRQALGRAPRLFVKRDDQTGLATGGNKTRKLEFVVAEALAQGADTLVTVGGPQSNHCRQTAAAAARLGLRCVLVLGGPTQPWAGWQGNLLLDDLLGAELRWAGERDRDLVLAETAEALRAEGARPYVVPLGASMPLGAAGYVAAVEELAGQLNQLDLRLDRLVFTSGSAGTHAGLMVGVKALGLPLRVEGICDDEHADSLLLKIKKLAADTARLLNLDLTFDESDFILHGATASPATASSPPPSVRPSASWPGPRASLPIRSTPAAPWPACSTSAAGVFMILKKLFSSGTPAALLAFSRGRLNYSKEQTMLVELGIGSCAAEISQDLPGHLYSGLEDGPFGYQYLAGLDVQLLGLVTRPAD